MTADELKKLAEDAIYNDTEALPHALTVFRNAANPAAILKLLAINAELVEALKGLDEAYCRAGPQLTRDERNIDRKRLIIARAALAKAEGGEL